VSDRALREAEQAWLGDPDDVEVAERYLVGCERAGVPAPFELLFERPRRARTVELPSEVVWLLTERESPGIHVSTRPTHRPVGELPEHRRLHARVKATSWARLAGALDELFLALEGEWLSVNLDLSELPAGELPLLSPARLDHLVFHCDRGQGFVVEQPSLLPALERLTLRSLSARGPVVERMPAVLDRLELTGDGEIDTEDLFRIRRRSPRLRELLLPQPWRHGCVSYLAAFPFLESLSFCRRLPLANKQGRELARLPRLRRLRLQVDASPPLGDGFLSGLAVLPLTHLTLNLQPRIAPELLQGIGQFEQLEELDLYAGEDVLDVSTEGWERLRRLRRFSLEAHGPGMRGQGLEFLTQLPELESLFLDVNWFGDAHLQVLARGWPPKLKSLVVRHAFQLSDASAHALRAVVPQLEHLWLSDTGLSPELVEELGGLHP